MPARASSAQLPYPPSLLHLINSTTFQSLPNIEELETLRSALQSQSSTISSRLKDRESNVNNAKILKRKEREAMDNAAAERAALEANEKAGMKLEAVVNARIAAQAQAAAIAAGNTASAGSGLGKKGSPMGVKVKKERTSLSPAPSNASSASFRPNHPGSQPMTYGGQMKKKSKHRVLDSDDEGAARDRSATIGSPPGSSHPPPHTTTSGLKVKIGQQKSRPGNTSNHSGIDPSPTPSTPAHISSYGSHIDFSIPSTSSRPLIPLRPGIARPAKPGPKRQSEVNEDYSDTKAPNQVQFTTWWNTVEPYIRDIREDDLAMLTLKADAPESYEIPPRGRHYTEIWEEEDAMPHQRISVPNLRQLMTPPPHGGLPIPHFIPSTELREETLVDEHRGLGAMTERVVAAVVGERGERSKDGDVEGKVAPEMENGNQANKVDVVDLEDRMRQELRAVMLLGEHEEFDPATRDDDEITSALRQCQRLLIQQVGINEQRKARLAEIARHRLAYSEYQSSLEGVEKSIETAWTKRIKKYGVKKSNSTSKETTNGSGSGSGSRPPVPENALRLIEVRKNWVNTVGRCMRERPRGEVLGLPTSSVYEGIGDDEENDEKSVEEVIDADMEVDDE